MLLSTFTRRTIRRACATRAIARVAGPKGKKACPAPWSIRRDRRSEREAVFKSLPRLGWRLRGKPSPAVSDGCLAAQALPGEGGHLEALARKSIACAHRSIVADTHCRLHLDRAPGLLELGQQGRVGDLVAIGIGEGGEFYRPMAVAIIGGTITSTLLTLLVVPSFYDSIEIARDKAVAKFHRRVPRFTVVGAFVLTLVEAIPTLLLVRFVWRLITWPVRRRRAVEVIGSIGV